MPQLCHPISVLLEHRFLCILPVVWAARGEITKILIVDSDRRRGSSVLQKLNAIGSVEAYLAEDRAAAVQAAHARQPEVAIVELGFQECDGPAVALQIATVARYVETLFFAGPCNEGELAAARDLGLARVVPVSRLWRMLAQILGPLAQSVRLRRRLESVEQHLHRVTSEEELWSSANHLTLPEAERRYRETYIRSLLAATGNRREAARRAGVPYTTLCEIIRKLGIPAEPRQAPGGEERISVRRTNGQLV